MPTFLLIYPKLNFMGNTRESDTQPKELISREALFELGILSPGQTPISQKLIFDSGMGSESWIYGIEIRTDGNKTIRVKQKNIISSAFDLKFKAEKQFRRLQRFAELGIPIPHIWGIRGASIYQEFLPDDRTKEALAAIDKGHLNIALPLLDQLISIGARLDASEFETADFLRDLMFDGESRRFVYLDVGSDLSESGKTDDKCKRQLTTRFRKHAEHIGQRYEATRAQLTCIPASI